MSSLLFKLLSAQGDSINYGARKIGIGLSGGQYYDNSFMYADLFRHCSVRIADGSFGAYSAYNSNGHPSTDCYLQIGSAFLKNGVYKLTFTGKCDSLTGGGCSVSNQVYDAGTNITLADVTISNEEISRNRWLQFIGTHSNNVADTNTGFSGATMYRPGYTSADYFTAEFLEAMQKFEIIRTMDATEANSNSSVTWGDRPLVSWLGPRGARGTAWELLVRAANESSSDLWINVPVRANDAYITNLANLIKYGSDGVNAYTSVQGSPVHPPLSQDLNIYVEYGNEVWNSGPGFQNYVWALEDSTAVKDDTSHPIAYDGAVASIYTALKRWVAWKASVISLSFRAVFGDGAMNTRVRPIFATQAGNSSAYLSTGVAWAKGFYGQVRAIAPTNPTIRDVRDLWYGSGGASYLDSVNNAPSGVTAPEVDAYFAGLPSPSYQERIAVDALWTHGYGLKLVAYEGGLEPGGSYLGGSTSPAIVGQTINQDPRMGAAMQLAQSIFDANGGDEFCYYIYSGPDYWSFANNLNRPLVADTATPKLLAVDSLRSANRSPITFGFSGIGAHYLKGGVVNVVGEAAGYYDSGSCYLLRDAGSFILAGVKINRAGTYLVSLSTKAATNAGIKVFVNGVDSGTITPSVVVAPVVTKTPRLSINLGVGLNVFRLEKVSGSGSNDTMVNLLNVEPYFAIEDFSISNMPNEPTYPQTLHTFSGSGLTYSITSGNPDGNFQVVGADLVMIGGTGIDFGTINNVVIGMSVTDNIDVDSFNISFDIGTAWYASDAIFAWNSIDAATDYPSVLGAINAAVGGPLALVSGTGAPVSGELWDMDGNKYKSTTGLASTFSGNNSFIVASVLDIDNHTAASVVILEVSRSSTYVQIQTSFAGISGLRVGVYDGATSSTPISPISAGKKVYWCYYDDSAKAYYSGVNQTASAPTSKDLSGKTFAKDVAIGGSSASAASSSMKHGSMQVVSRSGMTLASAKSIVAKMQDLHGIA